MDKIARLRIDLKDMPRPVWRRVEVPMGIYLSDLHLVIQSAMGWMNCHLYHFRLGYSVFFSELDPLEGDPPIGEERSSAETTLAELHKMLPLSRRFNYTYDFGDDWDHSIAVERIEPADPNAVYPRLLKAVRRCPPEDCGGPLGYVEYLEAISDPNHEQHEELLEWGDPDFDPEKVDTEALQAGMAHLVRDLRLEDRGGRKPIRF